MFTDEFKDTCVLLCYNKYTKHIFCELLHDQYTNLNAMFCPATYTVSFPMGVCGWMKWTVVCIMMDRLTLILDRCTYLVIILTDLLAMACDRYVYRWV